VSDTEGAPTDGAPSERSPTDRARSPRYGRFLVSGAALGLLVDVVVVLLRIDSVTRPIVLFFYLGLLLVGLGALLGGLVAVLVTGRTGRTR